MINLLEKKELNNKEQQKLFMDTIHHKSNKGYMNKVVIFNGDILLNVYSRRSSSLISDGTEGNEYVSLNTFRKANRSKQCVYNLGAMYFDLDGHEYNDEELEVAINNTKTVIKDAIESGELAPFSIINETGRGLSLYIVLTNSIAITSRTEKMARFYDAIYFNLTNKLSQILRNQNMSVLSVDHTVRDHSRIVRIPGTYNFKSRKFCKMIEFWIGNDKKPLTYTLQEIVNFNHLTWKIKEPKTDGAVDNEVNKTESILSIEEKNVLSGKNQIRALYSMQEDIENLDGCHEIMCFAFYNAMKRITSREKAVRELNDFNDRFQDRGISYAEIMNIINSCDRHIAPDGKYEGYYSLPDTWIKTRLDLTDEECQKYGFCINTEAQVKHETVVEDRLNTHKEVISAILSCDTYKDVVAVTNVPLRTVKRIAKAYDCSIKPNKRNIESINDIDWDSAKDILMNNDWVAASEISMAEAFLEEKMPKKTSNYSCNILNQNSYETNSYETKTNENNNKESTFDIEFDIEIEDDDKNDSIFYETKSLNIHELCTQKYSFQREMLTYIMNHADDSYINIAFLLEHTLSEITNKNLYDNAMKCMGYIGIDYMRKGGNVNTLAMDLDSLRKGLQREKIILQVHGIRLNTNKIAKITEYPYNFYIKPDYNDIIHTIHPVCKISDKLEPIFQQICNVLHVISRNSNHNYYVTGNRGFAINSIYFTMQLAKLTESDYIDVILFLFEKNKLSFSSTIRELWKRTQKV